MESDELFEYLDNISITDEQAANSDCEGDSDAEDQKLNTTTGSSSSRPPRSCQQPTTSTSGLIDFDSDDSIEDPDFEIDDTPAKCKPLFDDSDLDDEGQIDSPVATIVDQRKLLPVVPPNFTWTKS